MEAADSAHGCVYSGHGTTFLYASTPKNKARGLDTLSAFVATLNASIVGVVALDEKGEVRCLGVVRSLRLGAASLLMARVEAAAF